MISLRLFTYNFLN